MTAVPTAVVVGKLVAPAYDIIQLISATELTKHAASDRLRYWRRHDPPLAASEVVDNVKFAGIQRVTPGVTHAGAKFLAEHLKNARSNVQDELVRVFSKNVVELKLDFTGVDRKVVDNAVMVAVVPYIAALVNDQLKAMFQFSRIGRDTIAEHGTVGTYDRLTYVDRSAATWIATALNLPNGALVATSAAFAALFEVNRPPKRALDPPTTAVPDTKRLKSLSSTHNTHQTALRELEAQLRAATQEQHMAQQSASDEKQRFAQALELDLLERTAAFYAKVDSDLEKRQRTILGTIASLRSRLAEANAKLRELDSALARERAKLGCKDSSHRLTL